MERVGSAGLVSRPIQPGDYIRFSDVSIRQFAYARVLLTSKDERILLLAFPNCAPLNFETESRNFVLLQEKEVPEDVRFTTDYLDQVLDLQRRANIHAVSRETRGCGIGIGGDVG